MGKFFMPTAGPTDWKNFLAKPDKHWRSGYSAKALAYSWEEAGGFPHEVKQVLSKCAFPILRDIQILHAFPEYEVPLPGGQKGSQNDIFILGKSKGQIITIAVEGKVAESFDVTMSEWLEGASPGKRQRLKYLCSLLGISEDSVARIRYQLLHRTASALILAEQFNASAATMLVHSFSQEHERFTDYQEFLALFGQIGAPNSVASIGKRNGVETYLSWVVGDRRYLEV